MKEKYSYTVAWGKQSNIVHHDVTPAQLATWFPELVRFPPGCNGIERFMQHFNATSIIVNDNHGVIIEIRRYRKGN